MKQETSRTISRICPNIIKGKAYSAGRKLPVIDPANEELISEISEADPDMVSRAVKAARQTFEDGIWSQSSIEKRQHILNKIADLLEQNAEELAWLESRNIGAPISQSRARHVPRAVYNFRFFAEYISQSSHESYDQLEDYLTIISREPVGVAALIGPWNAPIALTTMKIAAAIAFGNSCVVKPSEVSPLTALRVLELMHEAGLPEGVVNLINGRGAITGAALAAHPDIEVLSFTGGTATGRAIMSAAGANLTPVTLELGGKSANIIFDDADFDQALDGALLGIFSNNGQQCLAGSRILLQKNIAERFLSAFVERTKNLRIGDPMDEKTEIGPLTTKEHFERVLSFADIAANEGAKILCGGGKVEGFTKGYYFNPTAVLVSDNKSRVCQEEIFGPFATFQIFETEEQAWQIANETRFGLFNYVWTENLQTAMTAHKRLQSGTICINTPIVRELRAPFGGFKESGVGRESGKACEHFYTEEKVTVIPTKRKKLNQMGCVAEDTPINHTS